MKRNLPPHLYRHGKGHRMQLPSGEKISLGIDREQALRRYHVMMSTPAPIEVASEDSIQKLLQRHAKGARQRRLEFTLTSDDIRKVIVAQGHRCAVTSLGFRDDKPLGLRIRPWAPSLDRRDGQQGYVSGNVRVVCAFVNIAMNGFGDDYFALVLEPLIEAAIAARLDGGGNFPIPAQSEKIPTSQRPGNCS